MLMGVERSERSGVNQNIPHYTERKPNSGKTIPRSVCEQVPRRKAVSNSQRLLEDSEHRETKTMTSTASPLDCQYGDGSCRPPDTLAKNVVPEFAPHRGKGGFDLHKKDSPGGAGSEAFFYSATPFLGTTEKKLSPRCTSESIHTNLRGPRETPRFKAIVCGSVTETERAASEESQGVGTQDTPEKDGGGPSSLPDWRLSDSTLPCDSHALFLGDRLQRTQEMLGDSVQLQQFSAAGCRPGAQKSNMVRRSGHTPDLPRETLHSQQGKMAVTLGHSSQKNSDVGKPDFRKLSGTGPSSVYPKPSRRLTVPLSSQQDSGFDSPFANLD
ncbi:centrosomal of 152 kDa [Sigmodon hispidus]